MRTRESEATELDRFEAYMVAGRRLHDRAVGDRLEAGWRGLKHGVSALVAHVRRKGPAVGLDRTLPVSGGSASGAQSRSR